MYTAILENSFFSVLLKLFRSVDEENEDVFLQHQRYAPLPPVWHDLYLFFHFHEDSDIS